jgi:hypothetical protein
MEHLPRCFLRRRKIQAGTRDGFVPEGQADSSQARSAWVALQRTPSRRDGEVIVSPEIREDKEHLGCFAPRRRDSGVWRSRNCNRGPKPKRLEDSTRLEPGFRLLVRTCKDCLLSTDPLLNSEFSIVSTFNPRLGSIYERGPAPQGLQNKGTIFLMTPGTSCLATVMLSLGRNTFSAPRLKEPRSVFPH